MGTEVRKCLNRQKRSVSWLAEELNCDQSNLNKKLNKERVHPDLLYEISQVLEIDLFACYSKQLVESKGK